jgi:hypothetical protein
VLQECTTTTVLHLNLRKTSRILKNAGHFYLHKGFWVFTEKAIVTDAHFLFKACIWFPEAAITNYHKLDGLKQQLISPQLWRLDCETELFTGPCTF